jgi:TonB family protein
MFLLLLALASPSPSPSPVAKKWVYASWFNSVKRLASAEWHGDAACIERNLKPAAPLQTTVRVTVDARGRLVRASVVRSSGLEFLDDEALAAFVRAAPYPTPPPPLLKDGEVEFDFSFLVRPDLTQRH